MNQESKYNKFEDLEVWQLSKQLYLDLYKIFTKKGFHNYSFQDQILRAGLSISNNIAEGCERQSNKELIRFLYIAKGSCGEVRSMMRIAGDLDYVGVEDIDSHIRITIKISVKLNNLIKYLKETTD